MKRKDIKRMIAEFFFQNPSKRLRVRQLERTLNASLPSVIRYTKELEAERKLKSEVVAEVKTYSADRASPYFLLEKRLFNIRSLFSSKLIAYLIKELSNPVIVIFGSYSLGEDVEDSDIDVYLETSAKTEIDLNKFEKVLQRKIQVFMYPSLKDIKNKNLANNVINGITLNGFLEVF